MTLPCDGVPRYALVLLARHLAPVQCLHFHTDLCHHEYCVAVAQAVVAALAELSFGEEIDPLMELMAGGIARTVGQQ